MNMNFYKKVKESEGEIRGIYTHFHRNPELSGQERETQSFILELLKQWQVECRPCADTGVWAVIRSGRPGHTIALRSDMDGLPVLEQTGLPYESEKKGVMHACGHDGHMTMLLGCIKVLQECQKELWGNFVFLFQPSEEKNGGAEPMIKAGALDSPAPELIIAFHLWPQKAHTITCLSGPVMAQPDAFCIEIEGKGGHGASPHLCKNPILALSSLALAILGITGSAVNAQEAAVVNVCQIRCGENYNLVAERGFLEGTIRTYDENVRSVIISRLKVLTESMATAYGMTGTFTMDSGYPATINEERAARWAHEVLEALMPEITVSSVGEPSMLGEDFSWYGKRCPALFLRLGCWPQEAKRQHPLHHSCFCVDESALTDGITAFCLLAYTFTKEGYQLDENC